MKRVLLAFLVAIFSTQLLHAWPRLGHNSTPTFDDDGYERSCFTYSLTDGAATLVYSGTPQDRETLFQNTSSTYDVWLTTFSTTNQSAPRMVVRSGTDLWTNNSGDLYGFAETGGTATLVGCSEFDPRD